MRLSWMLRTWLLRQFMLSMQCLKLCLDVVVNKLLDDRVALHQLGKETGLRLLQWSLDGLWEEE